MGSSFSSFWGLRVFGSSGLRFIGLCFRDTRPAKIEYSVVDSNANICNMESHRNRLVIYSFESKYHP